MEHPVVMGKNHSHIRLVLKICGHVVLVFTRTSDLSESEYSLMFAGSDAGRSKIMRNVRASVCDVGTRVVREQHRTPCRYYPRQSRQDA